MVDKSELNAEQTTLDEQEEKVMQLSLYLNELLMNRTNTQGLTQLPIAILKHLCWAQHTLESTSEAVDAASSEADLDTCLLTQYGAKLSDANSELTQLPREILALERMMMNSPSLRMNCMISTLPSLSRSIALYRRPTSQAQCWKRKEGSIFHGWRSLALMEALLLAWCPFWEQYSISVHMR